MQLTPQSQATMLLTVSFGKADSAGVKPLTNGEWARFAVWLRNNGLEPAALLHGDLETQLGNLVDRTIQISRIRALLDRGAALGFALEKWQRAGLWVLTRSDREYPERLKRRLRTASPPVLFGCGNKALLNAGGIAVVGSRNASDEDLAFTRSLGAEAAAQGFSIVSGGARGVDEAAMMGALDNEGTVTGVLADSLLRTSASSRFRKPLQSGDLLLITPFNPEAGFNAGNAMARNRYIYCLADAAVVVSSAPGKGGTWTGAVEALRHDWVGVWIKRTAEPASGNAELVALGARWLPEAVDSLAALLSSSEPIAGVPEMVSNADIDSGPFVDAGAPDEGSAPGREGGQTDTNTELASPTVTAVSFEAFLASLEDFRDKLPSNAKEISAQLGLKRADVDRFLKAAVERGLLEKLNRPVRFCFASGAGKQASLFD